MKKLIVAIILDLIILAVAGYGLANQWGYEEITTVNHPVVFEHHPVIYEGELPPGIAQQDPLRTAYLIVDEFGNIKEVSKEEFYGGD